MYVVMVQSPLSQHALWKQQMLRANREHMLLSYVLLNHLHRKVGTFTSPAINTVTLFIWIETV